MLVKRFSSDIESVVYVILEKFIEGGLSELKDFLNWGLFVKYYGRFWWKLKGVRNWGDL